MRTCQEGWARRRVPSTFGERLDNFFGEEVFSMILNQVNKGTKFRCRILIIPISRPCSGVGSSLWHLNALCKAYNTNGASGAVNPESKT